MKPRTLTAVIHRALRSFPAVVVTGPRQSGKTTLLKSEFGKTHQYISMENPDIRLRVKHDPIGFIQTIKLPAILDEIQYTPELLPYIKTAIDERRLPGRWILTGSQNFALMQNISESLAGRSAILSLQPFTLSERINNGLESGTVQELLQRDHEKIPSGRFNLALTVLRGNYPEIASHIKVDRALWCSSYITTYLERDIRNLSQVGDLGQYEIFLRTCATRTGQILDLSAIAREIGISFTTAKRWLSLLETGYQIFLLRPYYRNIGKRLVKRPKLYFTDTGLASYLLGIQTAEQLMAGPFLGPLFETLVVTDFWKRFLHHGQIPSMYYLRTQDDLEVDLILELADRLNLIEIKASSTITPEHATSVMRVNRDLKEIVGKTLLISNSQERFLITGNIYNMPITFLLA